MKDHNSMVKNNFEGDTDATNERKSHISSGYIDTLNGKNGYVSNLGNEKKKKVVPKEEQAFVQVRDEEEAKGGRFGKADDTFQPGKIAAAAVVAKQ